MTSARRQAPVRALRASVPADPGSTEQLRRMVLLLETAAVLERRALRAADATQAAVLRRRAEQRRLDAARLRRTLAARGIALSRPVGAH